MKAHLVLVSLVLSVGFGAFASDKEATAEGHAAPHGKAEGHRDNGALFPQPQQDISKATAPAATALLEPKFQAAITAENATLTWKEVTGADVYHVQVATDPNFKWLQADEHNVKGTSFEVKNLKKGQFYFWRVAAWKNANMAAANKGPFTSSMFEVK